MKYILSIVMIIAKILPIAVAAPSIGDYGVTCSGFDEQLLLMELMPLITQLSEVTGISPKQVLPIVYGNLNFKFELGDYPGYSCWSWLTCYGSVNPLTDPKANGLLIHELGHRFMNDLNMTFDELDLNIGYLDENGTYIHVTGVNPMTGRYERTAKGYPADERPYMQHSPSVPVTGQTYQEDFADMFMAWTLDRFSDDEAGRLRYEWMDRFVRGDTPMKFANGTAHCEDCKILFWRKDLREGICFDCYIKRVKKRPKQIALGLKTNKKE